MEDGPDRAKKGLTQISSRKGNRSEVPGLTEHTQKLYKLNNRLQN